MKYAVILSNPDIIKELEDDIFIKSPTKYFKVFEHAKIYQLQLNIKNHYNCINVEDSIHHPMQIGIMEQQLNELGKEYPEYIV